MNYSELYESKKRGTFDFPVELYRVDERSARYQMPLHWHLEYEIILILSGSFELSLDGKSFVMNKGDCAWIGDGVVHGGVPNDCIYACVVCDLGTLLHDTPVCSRSSAQFLADESGSTGVFKAGSVQAEIAEKIFDSMEHEQRGYEWTTIGLIWQLMGSLINLKKQNNTSDNRKQIIRLKNVLTYIRDNYENAVALEELALIAGIAPRYFCRAFSKLTGKTPIEYLNYYRIELAGERLLFSYEKVTDIALNCGFNDMSYFSKVFAKHKGMSPTAYRKKYKK